MAKGKKKVKEGFWIGLAVVVIIVLALMMEWWKTHAVIGWILVAIFILALAFSLYRFPSFRKLIIGTAKNTGEKIIFEEEASNREPVPQKMRQDLLARANNKCENPDCNQRVKPHIHHIDGNNKHNSYRNLVVLCPNCHTKAHSGEYTPSQLRVWVNYSWERFKNKQYQKKSRR